MFAGSQSYLLIALTALGTLCILGAVLSGLLLASTSTTQNSNFTAGYFGTVQVDLQLKPLAERLSRSLEWLQQQSIISSDGLEAASTVDLKNISATEELVWQLQGKLQVLKRYQEETVVELSDATVILQKMGESSRALSAENAPSSAENVAEQSKMRGTEERRFESQATNLTCTEQAMSVPRQKLKWTPEKGKFLFATCVHGRLSNRLRCFFKYMFAATLLNRTLVLPMEDLNGDRPRYSRDKERYDFSLVFNVSHTKACFGGEVVQTLKDHLKSRGQKEISVQVVAWGPQSNKLTMETPKALKLPPSSRWIRKVPETGVSVTKTRFVELFSDISDEVFTIVGIEWLKFTGEPPAVFLGLASSWQTDCALLTEPHGALRAAAEGFVASYLAPTFAAAHVRRSDFFRKYAGRNDSIYLSIQQISKCLRHKMGKLGLETLFLATDASEEEVTFLEKLLSRQSDIQGTSSVTLLRLPVPLKGRMWADKMFKENVRETSLARATIEKLVCSEASVFFSSGFSTFSSNIAGFRNAWNKSSCYDSHICKYGSI